MHRTYAIIDHESSAIDRTAHDRYLRMERFARGLDQGARNQRGGRNDALHSPRWVFQEIVTASIMICTEHADGNIEPMQFVTLSAPDHDERTIIKGLLDVLDDAPPRTELVSWGGVWHDVPLLVARAMRHGLTLPREWAWMAWGSHGPQKHIDLLRVLTGGAKMKPIHMTELAAALDIPAKLTQPAWAGSRLIEQGDFEAVQEMCECDIITTALLLSYWRQLIDGRAPIEVAQDRILRRVEELRAGRSYIPAITAKRAALFAERARAARVKMEIIGLPMAA